MYNVIIKGAYIKCVGGQGWRVFKMFQKTFPSPGDHRPKYFMDPQEKLYSRFTRSI